MAVQPQHIFVPHLFFFIFSPPRRSMLFLAGDLTQWHLPVGMKDLDLGGCRALTGTARLRESSLNMVLNRLRSALASSFLTFSFSLFPFRRGCDAAPASRWYAIPQFVRGIRQPDADNGYVLIIDMFRLSATSRTRFLIPHCIHFPLLASPPARCCRQDRAPRRHAACELLQLLQPRRYGRNRG